MPDELAHVWQWYLDLSASRGGGFGYTPISYVDIDAYSRLMGASIRAFEAKLIRGIDDVAIRIVSAKPEAMPDGVKSLVKPDDAGGVLDLVRGLGKKPPKPIPPSPRKRGPPNA